MALCASFFLYTSFFTSSFQHQVFALLLLPFFFKHTSSHAFRSPSLKCPHKFGTPTSTNFILFLQIAFWCCCCCCRPHSTFLVFTSFSKHIFLLSANSVLCVQSDKWIYGKYAGLKRMIPFFQDIWLAGSVNRILERLLCEN